MKSSLHFFAVGFVLSCLAPTALGEQEPAISAEQTPAASQASASAAPQISSDPKLESPTDLEALDTQIALARKGFSPGVLDGMWGRNTEQVLASFQKAKDLEVTGQLDAKTREALGLPAGAAPENHEGGNFQALRWATLTEEQVAGPFLEQELPEKFQDQASLEALLYESVEEKLAEHFHTTPEALRELNPEASFAAGQKILVPDLGEEIAAGEDRAQSTIRVSKEAQILEVFGPNGEHLFSAPATAGSTTSPLPLGEWKVVSITEDPNFHFNPSILEDVPDTEEEKMIAPGPNNPVGVVWIDLNREHYGIHGASSPEKIGYEESHGCVRLTNWDAETVARLVAPGAKVLFEP
jgi:lipoprotein-anchoring transpeptidase ErfK/SrfK